MKLILLSTQQTNSTIKSRGRREQKKENRRKGASLSNRMHFISWVHCAKILWRFLINSSIVNEGKARNQGLYIVRGRKTIRDTSLMIAFLTCWVFFSWVDLLEYWSTYCIFSNDLNLFCATFGKMLYFKFNSKYILFMLLQQTLSWLSFEVLYTAAVINCAEFGYNIID